MAIFNINNKNFNIPVEKISEFWAAMPYAKLTEGTIQSLIEDRVKLSPDNIAIVYEGKNITYREFNEKANRIANYLLKKYNIQPDDKIGLFLDRDEYYPIGTLAALKSGGAYVSIDPYAPEVRISFILSDTAPKVILASSIFKDQISEMTANGTINNEVVYVDDEVFIQHLLEIGSSENPSTETKPHHLAYLIYTSGTTGNPKGVMAEHGNAINFFSGVRKLYTESIKGYAEMKNCLIYYNYVFDAHVLDIYLPLIDGKTLYIYGTEKRLEIPYLRKFVKDNKIDICGLPAVLLDKESSYACKLVWSGGETLNQEMVNTYVKQGIDVVNVYGPTEITVSSNMRIFKEGDKSTNIGAFLFNYVGYIVDENMKLLPPGAIGELYIGGNGVSRGYINNTELTAERYLKNPFQTDEEKRYGFNDRIYKTGDLVKSLPDGSYEFLGRNDHQVKIRGFRIELGEINSVLVSYPEIKHAQVLAKENASGMKFLAAYYTATQKIDEDILNQYLQNILPEYMIPAVYIHLDRFVLNANGKIEYRALPEPEFHDKEAFVLPSNQTEEDLCHIYGEILNIEPSKIGVNSDFFKLGGNSILAIRLVDKIIQKFDKEIQIVDVFACRTVRNFANKLQQSQEGYAAIIVPKINSVEEQVLSFAQERLWFIEQYENGSSVYNIPIAFKLKADTNIESLIQSIHAVIDRHQILRTTISSTKNGTSYQAVQDEKLKIHEIKLNSIQDLKPALTKTLNHIFDLSTEYPIYIELYAVGQEYYMSITIHHIAFDGWSGDIFIKEILNNYKYFELKRIGKDEEALSYVLPELKLQYKDYALWQRNYLQGTNLDDQLAFWKNQLDGYEELNLSTDKIRPSQIDYTGNDIYFTLNNTVSNNLRKTAQELGISLYSLLFSGFYVLLSTYTNQEDILVGSPSANRNKTEISEVIGYFVNALAIRRMVNKEDSVIDFITETADYLSLVQHYQELPFEKLVEELNVKKDLSRNPIFQVMFSLQSFGNEQNDEKNSLLEIYPIHTEVGIPVAKFDLMLMMDDSLETLSGSFNYQTSLFEVNTIQSYIDTYKNILEQFSNICNKENSNKKIAELTLLNEQTYNQIVFDWNAVELNHSSTETLHSLFEKQVKETPNHTAIVFGENRITYNELNEKSNLLAQYLKERYTIQPDDKIALCLDRSAFIPIAILAVMKSGAAYVPMDTLAPSERLTYMINDTKAKVILTMSEHGDKLKNLDIAATVETINTANFFNNLKLNYSADDFNTQVTPQNLAYIIYTSGTTGNPKGVMVEHHSVISLFKAGAKLYHFNDKDVWMLFHSYTFDFSVWELWGALLYGGKLVIPTYEDTRNMALFYKLCQSEKLSILNQTPSAFYQFMGAAVGNATKIDSLRYVIFGGEVLNTSQLVPWFDMYEENKPYLVNMYGITETTVFATYPKALKKLELNQIPSIGRTLEGYTSYVLDTYKRPLPTGAIGELYLGGVGVTRGYLNNPELTKERFVCNPFQTESEKEVNFNGVLYKSGDLVKLTETGDLKFIGRNDFQVKIRGFRIELEEIAARLSQMPTIQQSIILVKEHADDIKYLVAYYVANAPLETDEIKSYMEQYLPDYMIPSFFIYVKEFPLTVNGKLDQKSLPEPTYVESKNYIAPQTEIEKQLCTIFSEALKIEASKISVNDDFFEIGGNSIVATKLIQNINNTLNVKVRIIDIFMERTIAKMAKVVMQNSYKTIVDLNESTADSAIFMVHPGGGGSEAYLPLAEGLKEQYKCYGIDSYNMYQKEKIDDLNKLAHVYVEAMDKVSLSTSYTLLGWSLGGLIAMEIASILEARGIKDITIYLLDTIVHDKTKGKQVEMFTDEEITKMIEKYDGLQFYDAKKLLSIENKLTNQILSTKLKNSKVVLFKAMLNNEEWNESNRYYMDSVMENTNHLKVVQIHDATHDQLLDRQEIIIQTILNTK